MIITETIKLNNKDLIHTYSDKNLSIKKIGTEEIYAEAYDLPEKNYTYEEIEELEN